MIKAEGKPPAMGAFEAQMVMESVINAKNAVALAANMVSKHDAMQSTLISLVHEVENLKKQASHLVSYMEKWNPEDPAAIEMAKKISRSSSAPRASMIASNIRRAVLATKKASMEAGSACKPETLRELSESIVALDSSMI